MSFFKLKAEVRDYFETFIERDGKEIRFPYKTGRGMLQYESWNANGIRVPVSEGMWLATQLLPVSVSNLFVAYSASDILCFLQYSPHWLAPRSSAAFAALGLLPSKPQIDYLSSRFPNAKLHTLFDASITGTVASCKVAAWRCGKEVKFELQSNQLSCRLNARQFVISENRFSLSCFEGIADIRNSVKVRKPKPPFNTYVEFFIAGASRV